MDRPRQWRPGAQAASGPAVNYEPTESVYIVLRDPESITSIMVFDSSDAAHHYAERVGGEVLEPEPVFDTSDHCIEWCGAYGLVDDA